MREIKFRQFVEGKFNYWGVGICDVDGYPSSFAGPVSGGGIRADRTPQEQYTGLKDNEGVEIYEGDIISVVSKSNAEVKYFHKVYWDDGSFVIDDSDMCQSIVCSGLTGSGGSSHLCFVVGNIHQHPELINGKQ